MPTFTELPLEDVKIARFNPSKRSDRTRLTGLLLSIREHGILEPLVLTQDRILADGHRRLACAKLLKMETVPVAIHSESGLDAPTLWVILNADTMNLTPSQWLAAVDAGLALDTPGFPDSLRRRVERLIDLVGREGLRLLVEQGRSPYIIDAADRVVRYCDRRDDEIFYRQTLDWLIHVGNSFNVRSAIVEEVPSDLLSEAIVQGRELARVWDIS